MCASSWAMTPSNSSAEWMRMIPSVAATCSVLWIAPRSKGVESFRVDDIDFGPRQVRLLGEASDHFVKGPFPDGSSLPKSNDGL
jgi:hypothetical protein